MIKLPNFEKKFEYENNFYLSSDSSRMAKALAHFKLLEKTVGVEGSIIECGIFKGASFSRFGMYRKLLGLENKKIIGFDTFGYFPETQYQDDIELREKFINIAGDQSISVDQLYEVLKNKECDQNVELVEGDIVQTMPSFIDKNPDLKISLLNLDVDIYEPTVTILEHLYPRISSGGILILDDYGSFPGETNAVDEYFKDKNVTIETPILPGSPQYIIKN